MSKERVAFLDEEGNKVEFKIVEKINIEEDKYVLLAREEEEEGDAYVYKIVEEDGVEQYVAVDDDDEFEKVLEEYNSYFDEE
ncbi:DUF1292 domain-containing protein [Tepidibacter hydrothermalis]|uniref:DUF1292 domain-containing protein n=1 Tax=Tepidibacter hydrothermalis TaxID=3036126 RepID=A0ABY8E8Y9_9FIRM|nr:DUF1292 domain-containing protein [Tepidibacter hydrothermalis]WFD09352.1 DUF1292 domain-containing protein [Tepidibacter hydrothermalis]